MQLEAFRGLLCCQVNQLDHLYLSKHNFQLTENENSEEKKMIFGNDSFPVLMLHEYLSRLLLTCLISALQWRK